MNKLIQYIGVKDAYIKNENQFCSFIYSLAPSFCELKNATSYLWLWKTFLLDLGIFIEEGSECKIVK